MGDAFTRFRICKLGLLVGDSGAAAAPMFMAGKILPRQLIAGRRLLPAITAPRHSLPRHFARASRGLIYKRSPAASIISRGRLVRILQLGTGAAPSTPSLWHRPQIAAHAACLPRAARVWALARSVAPCTACTPRCDNLPHCLPVPAASLLLPRRCASSPPRSRWTLAREEGASTPHCAAIYYDARGTPQYSFCMPLPRRTPVLRNVRAGRNVNTSRRVYRHMTGYQC